MEMVLLVAVFSAQKYFDPLRHRQAQNRKREEERHGLDHDDLLLQAMRIHIFKKSNPTANWSDENIFIEEDEENEENIEPMQSLERILMDETALDSIQMECDYGGVQIKGNNT